MQRDAAEVPLQHQEGGIPLGRQDIFNMATLQEASMQVSKSVSIMMIKL